jgi:hypothetical protein
VRCAGYFGINSVYIGHAYEAPTQGFKPGRCVRLLLLGLAVYCGCIAGSLLNKAITGRWLMVYPNIFDPRRVFAFLAMATFTPLLWLRLILAVAAIASILCFALSRPNWRWIGSFLLFVAVSFGVSYVWAV